MAFSLFVVTSIGATSVAHGKRVCLSVRLDISETKRPNFTPNFWIIPCGLWPWLSLPGGFTSGLV